MEGLDGLELVGNWHINDKNIASVMKLFRDNGLAIPMIVPDLWTQAKWGRGSLAAADAATRREAVAEVKKCMDWAAEAGCPFVDVWPGQDGCDYPFQADFSDAWKWLRDGVAECAAHSKKVKVLVEYKLREPRNHCFLSSAAKTILLIQGIPNTGCLLDVGHSLAAGDARQSDPGSPDKTLCRRRRNRYPAWGAWQSTWPKLPDRQSRDGDIDQGAFQFIHRETPLRGLADRVSRSIICAWPGVPA